MTPPSTPFVKPLPGVNPWPGLEAFTSYHKFCGRDSDIDELARRMKRRVGAVLYGQSGLGKTSLLQAGIIPLLKREHYVPMVVRLIHKEDAPPLADQVRHELHRAIDRAGLFEPVYPEPDEDLWRYLHRRDVSWLLENGHEARPVLIFDQFEEIFTNGQSTPELARRSREFFAELANLVQGRLPTSLEAEITRDPELATSLKQENHDYHILLAMREDFLPHLDTAVERFEAPDLVSNRHRLLPFDGLSALQAVEGPGAGIVDENVAELIVRKVAAAKQRHLSVTFLGEDDGAPMDLADLRIEPALLSLMCSQLNKARIELEMKSGNQERITAALVQHMGGQVLDDFYRQALQSLPERVRGPMADFIEEQLISEGGQHRQQFVFDTAERHLVNRGVPLEEARQSFRSLIDEHRLLRTEDRGDVPRIELTHDVLCAVVGRCRDERRLRAQRMKWWKNAASAAAVVLFFCSIGLGIYAWNQRSKAKMEAAQAMEQAELAQTASEEALNQTKAAVAASKEATAQKVEADRQKQLAEDARKKAIAAQQQADEERAKARRNLGRWYEQRIVDAAHSQDLATAALIRAHGMQDAEMRSSKALGFVAPAPMLQRLGRINLGRDTRIARVQWLHEGRSILAQTVQGHLCIVSGAPLAARWLTVQGKGMALLQEGPEAPNTKKPQRVEVFCATPWRDGSGAHGILASVKDTGLWFVPVADKQVAASRFPRENGVVTALLQSPHSGVTWAGLANGVVYRLSTDAASVEGKPIFCPPKQESEFEPGTLTTSPSGQWYYLPVDSDEENLIRDRDGSRSADPGRFTGRSWAMVRATAETRRALSTVDPEDPSLRINSRGVVLTPDYVSFGAPLPHLENVSRERPDRLIFSPDDRSCLLLADGIWSRIVLSAGKTASQPPQGQPGAGANPGAPRPPEAGTSGGNQNQPASSLKGIAPDDSLAFLDGDLLVFSSGLTLKTYSFSDGKILTTTPLKLSSSFDEDADKPEIVNLLASRDGAHVVVVLRDGEDIIGFQILKATRNASTFELAPLTTVTLDDATMEVPRILNDASGLVWKQTHSLGTSSAETYWIAFKPNAKPEPLPGRLISQLPPNRVGGLALDAQGGILCVSVESGVGCYDAMTDKLLDGFLNWPNPKCETLISKPGRNLFTTQISRWDAWQLGIEPYVHGLVPAFSIDVVKRNDAMPHEGDRDAYALAYHPDGRTHVTSTDRGLLVWDGRVIEQSPVDASAPTALSFSPDGRVLAGGNENGDLICWSFHGEKSESISVFTDAGGRIRDVEGVPAGNGELVLADATGLHRWNPSTGQMTLLPLPPKTKSVLTVAAGKEVTALVETTDGRILLCRADDASVLASAPLSVSAIFNNEPPLHQKLHSVSGAEMMADGAAFALFGPEGLVELWRRDGEKLIPLALPAQVKAASVAFDPKGAALLTQTEGESSLVRWTEPSQPKVDRLKSNVDAAVFVPRLEKFLVSGYEWGLALLDPVRLEPVTVGNLEGLPIGRFSHLIVAADGSLALAVQEDGCFLVDPADTRIIGRLACATAKSFLHGGCFLEGGPARLVGFSESEARAWKCEESWDPAEAMSCTGLQMSQELQASPLDAKNTRDFPAPPVPPMDPTLAQAWSAAVRVRMELAAGGRAQKEDEPLPQRMRHAGEPIQALLASAKPLPSALRATLDDLAGLAAFRVTDARSAAQIMKHFEDLSSSSTVAAADLEASGADAWPGTIRGDFNRLVTLAHWERLLVDRGEKPLLTPDQLDFAEELREGAIQHLAALKSAREEGGFRHFPTSRVSQAFSSMKSALAKTDRTITDSLADFRRKMEVRHAIALLEAPKVDNWNQYAYALDQYHGANTADTTTDKLSDRLREYRRAVWLQETFSATGDVSYSLASWAKLIHSNSHDRPDDHEREAWKRAAVALAREATKARDSSDHAWTVLRDVSRVDDERVRAGEKVVELLRSGDASDLLNARNLLGGLYSELYRMEAISLFEEVLATHPKEVYALVEKGALMRGFGAVDEWRKPFETAVEVEEEKLAPVRAELKAAQDAKDEARIEAARQKLNTTLEGSDEWGRLQFGHALAQYGFTDEAVRVYGEALEMQIADNYSPTAVYELALLALFRNDSEAFEANIQRLRDNYMWDSLANVARRIRFLKPGDPRITEFAEEALKKTEATPRYNWSSRMNALDALGRPEEAIKVIEQHIADTAEEERDSSFWIEMQKYLSVLVAGRSPAESLWHLAQAAGHGWHDDRHFIIEPALTAALKDQPLLTQLRDTLKLRYDEPARYIALARYINDAAEHWRKAGGKIEPKEQAALLVQPITRAIRLGWQDPDDLLKPNGALHNITTAPGWPVQQQAARDSAITQLHAEAEALAAAWTKVWKETQNERNPSALLARLLKDVAGHARLKRAKGNDLFGRPLKLDLIARTITFSPDTLRTAKEWSPRDEDFWTIRAEPPAGAE